MRKSLRRWPVLVSLLVAFGALPLALVYLPFGSRVTLANCKRIQVGMSEAEVRAILGKPWDDSLLDAELPSSKYMVKAGAGWAPWYREMILATPDEGPGQGVVCSLWVGKDAAIFVVFTLPPGQDGQVVSTKLLTGAAVGSPRTISPFGSAGWHYSEGLPRKLTEAASRHWRVRFVDGVKQSDAA